MYAEASRGLTGTARVTIGGEQIAPCCWSNLTATCGATTVIVII